VAQAPAAAGKVLPAAKAPGKVQPSAQNVDCNSVIVMPACDACGPATILPSGQNSVLPSAQSAGKQGKSGILHSLFNH
jgi:hypothetical protein